MQKYAISLPIGKTRQLVPWYSFSLMTGIAYLCTCVDIGDVKGTEKNAQNLNWIIIHAVNLVWIAPSKIIQKGEAQW